MSEISQQLARLGVNPDLAPRPVSTLSNVILHLVTFSWRPDVTNDDVVAVIEGLGSLPAQIPELLSYRFGPDLGLREGNADFAVAAVLESPDTLPAYLDHPEHQRIATEFIAPLVATRQAVQIELPADISF
ncbi:MAG: Dabb family protein [Actinomycetota bacterium]|nr:Dabb family protein [Actinomycetota bacterium]